MKDFLLFALVAVLVAAVAYFGVLNAGKADDVAEGVGRVEKMLGDLTATLDQRIADAVRKGLEGDDERIAGKVLEGLRREGLRPSTGSCGGGRKAPMKSVPTLFYENARFNSEKDLNEGSPGIRLTDAHKTRLGQMASAFAPCARPPDHVVKFKVKGYSSTAEFKMLTADGPKSVDGTDRHNLRAANLRAKVVAERLREDSFEAEAKQWKSYHKIPRPFLDNSESLAGETDQEALNRSVFIKVLNSGACDIREGPALNS